MAKNEHRSQKIKNKTVMTFREKTDKALELFLVIFMSALVINVVWQVASRYLFASPSTFTDELAGFLLIWVGMLGAAYVKGKNEHLAIDLLHEKLSPSNKAKLLIFINVLVIAFAISIMVIGGIWLVYTRFVLGQISAAMQLPLGWVYVVVPISGLLMSYYAVDDIKLLFNKLKELSTAKKTH